MQFIDQSAAYNRKSISLADAVKAGRANLTLGPDAEKLGVCFRPELAVATAFDRSINTRLKFADLSTPDKLDLMIDELLPGFFHADILPRTGRDNWRVRFVVDGTVRRTLEIDANGVRATKEEPDQSTDIEVETDAVTLMAILRSVIAEYHTNKPRKVLNAKVAGLNTA
jgi:hypothetical protein